jgi:hypothetical protein
MRPAPPKIILRLIAALMALVAWLLVTPAEATGLLIPGDASLGPLAIRSHRVNVEIHERVAETRVVQVFRNHTDRVLEATYIFPIPAGASVSGFAMMVNGRGRGRCSRPTRPAGSTRASSPGCATRVSSSTSAATSFARGCFPFRRGVTRQVEIRFTQTVDYQSPPCTTATPCAPRAAGEHDGGLHPQRHHRVAGAHSRGVLPHAPHRHHAPRVTAR